MSLPWFRWFPTTFRGDALVAMMSAQARGAYRDLLDVSWEMGALKDPQKDLKALGWNPKLWAEISPCWHLDRKKKGFVQDRLEAERKLAEKRYTSAVKAQKEREKKRKRRARASADDPPKSD